MARIPEFKTPKQFWAKMEHCGRPVCWQWAGTRNAAGRGVLTYQNKLWTAHRLAYFLTHGNLPDLDPTTGDVLIVIQTCGNKSCCRPAHLKLTTREAANKARPPRRRRKKEFTFIREVNKVTGATGEWRRVELTPKIARQLQHGRCRKEVVNHE